MRKLFMPIFTLLFTLAAPMTTSAEALAPASPMMSSTLETRPSEAPNTAARSPPP